MNFILWTYDAHSISRVNIFDMVPVYQSGFVHHRKQWYSSTFVVPSKASFCLIHPHKWDATSNETKRFNLMLTILTTMKMISNTVLSTSDIHKLIHQWCTCWSILGRHPLNFPFTLTIVIKWFDARCVCHHKNGTFVLTLGIKNTVVIIGFTFVLKTSCQHWRYILW